MYAIYAVESWYSEIEDYDWNTGASSNGEIIGDFTQVTVLTTKIFMNYNYHLVLVILMTHSPIQNLNVL